MFHSRLSINQMCRWIRLSSCPAKAPPFVRPKVREVLGGANFALVPHQCCAWWHAANITARSFHARSVQINKLIVSIYIKLVNFWCAGTGDDTIRELCVGNWWHINVSETWQSRIWILDFSRRAGRFHSLTFDPIKTYTNTTWSSEY